MLVNFEVFKNWSLQIMYDEHYMGWSDGRIFYKVFLGGLKALHMNVPTLLFPFQKVF